jgi:hypothetical protein
MRQTSKIMLIVCILIVLLVAACVALDNYVQNDAPMTVAVVGSALLVFSGSVIMCEYGGVSWISNTEGIRASIALSIVIEYIVLVGIVAFFKT